MPQPGFSPKASLNGRRALLLAGAALGLAAARPAAAVPTYQFSGTIPIPVTGSNTTGTFVGYDLSTFDATNQLHYLTDRSNNGIDVFSAKTNGFVTQLGAGSFAGNTAAAANAGPNGISITTLGDGSRLLLAGNAMALAGLGVLMRRRAKVAAPAPAGLTHMA